MMDILVTFLEIFSKIEASKAFFYNLFDPVHPPELFEIKNLMFLVKHCMKCPTKIFHIMKNSYSLFMLTHNLREKVGLKVGPCPTDSVQKQILNFSA